MRSLFSIVLTAATILTMGLGIAQNLHVEPACEGLGFEGTLQEGKRVLLFSVCVSDSYRYATLTTPTRSLVEVDIDREKDAQIAVGGVAIGAGMSEEDRFAAVSAIHAPEALLAARLIPVLEAAGYDRSRADMKTLALVLMALRRGGDAPGGDHESETHAGSDCDECSSSPGACSCSDMRCDCIGCCGLGCAGCTGICSVSCWKHDVCVRAGGAGGCMGELVDALISMLACDMTNCEYAECYDCW